MGMEILRIACYQALIYHLRDSITLHSERLLQFQVTTIFTYNYKAPSVNNNIFLLLQNKHCREIKTTELDCQ